jgi:hypothetical protein
MRWWLGALILLTASVLILLFAPVSSVDIVIDVPAPGTHAKAPSASDIAAAVRPALFGLQTLFLLAAILIAPLVLLAIHISRAAKAKTKPAPKVSG